MKTDPFFIVGCPRSGTTLLRLYLNAHSQLSIPAESHFIIDLIEVYGVEYVIKAEDVKGIFNLVSQHPRWLNFSVSDERMEVLVADAVGGSMSSMLESLYASAVGEGLRWGDKTPQYALYIDQLAKLFPRAQFIHIVRDGRDVWQSLRMRKRWFVWTDFQRAMLWRKYIIKASKSGENLGDAKYLQVRYEDLVRNPESSLISLSKFLNVDFESQMLDFYLSSDKYIAGFEKQCSIHRKLDRPPQASDFERWRNELTAKQLTAVEMTIGDVLLKSGYELSGIERRGSFLHCLQFVVVGVVASFLQPLYNLIGRGCVGRSLFFTGVKGLFLKFFHRF